MLNPIGQPPNIFMDDVRSPQLQPPSPPTLEHVLSHCRITAVLPAARTLIHPYGVDMAACSSVRLCAVTCQIISRRKEAMLLKATGLEVRGTTDLMVAYDRQQERRA